ncbi:MAG: sulfatase-like hydrolase/transferase [Leptospirales bacterium]|nr:sulfatase-like hydrolase/transferase [Leptospirales bacterium]
MLAADILMTGRQEAASFFTGQAVLSLVFFMAIMLLLAAALKNIRVNIFDFKRIRTRSIANTFFFVLLIFGHIFHWYPQRTYYKIYEHFKQAQNSFLGEYKTKMIQLENTEEASSLSAPLPQESVLFLHIGESVRGDHAPMNGYYRNTMPRMMKELKRGNLFSFKRCISFSTSTKFSIPGILLPATIADPVMRSSSFIPFLKKHGVKTSSFYSQTVLGAIARADIGKIIFLQHIMEVFSSPLFAHSIIPDIREFIVSNPSNIFILYIGEGSHVPYNTYDIEKFTVFEPVNFRLNKNQSTINAYDNSIVCTDDFCGEILDSLRERNAVYIYVSDHGAPLGENGIYGRGGEDKMSGREFRDVLCFIWASDEFKKKNPVKFAALKANAALPIISHDNIYHTVLGFYGIKNARYDAELDLFTREAKPFAGPLPEELPANAFMGELLFE